MVNKYLKVTLFAVLIFSSSQVLATKGPPTPPTVPLDAGIFGLIILGVAFGIKKIRDHSKK